MKASLRQRSPAKWRRVAAATLVLGGLSAGIVAAHGQPAQPPASEPPPAADLTTPPPAENAPRHGPGLIDKLGEWLRDSAAGVASGMKGTQQQIEQINKGTLDTLSGIPVAGFASGRVLCPRAANGAPDCYAATEKLCKDKGYSAGRSLDTESSETCNPRIYLPGYQRKPGDCRIDTFVVRAACQ
jgi:hypothetical protein